MNTTAPLAETKAPGARRVAIFGAGGLGRTMAQLLDHKQSLVLCGLCDNGGYAWRPEGISGRELAEALPPGASVAAVQRGGCESTDGMAELLRHSGEIDAIFLALPNLPNEFIPGVVRQIAAAGYRGVIVDALKRTRAVRMVLEMREELAAGGITYVTGAGATPGLLTAAAALAAQSFVEITDVKIWFGVGIANWEAYRATIREDIAHLAGFDVEKVKLMSDAEVEAELERRNGLLELPHMEHADDVMLEDAGVCSREVVRVGGLVDTRNAKKPVSTSVTITGRTFEGKTSSHVFTLGDETSMAANVNGTALGYMNAALAMRAVGTCGVFTAAQLMPQWPR